MQAAALTVEVHDPMENRCRARVGGNEPVHRVIPALVERMKLPKVALDGQPLRYSLEVQDGNNPFFTRRLAWDDTLARARVPEGAVLVIFVEMIAG